jgi:hypothetical protein
MPLLWLLDAEVGGVTDAGNDGERRHFVPRKHCDVYPTCRGKLRWPRGVIGTSDKRAMNVTAHHGGFLVRLGTRMRLQEDGEDKRPREDCGKLIGDIPADRGYSMVGFGPDKTTR